MAGDQIVGLRANPAPWPGKSRQIAVADETRVSAPRLSVSRYCVGVQVIGTGSTPSSVWQLGQITDNSARGDGSEKRLGSVSSSKTISTLAGGPFQQQGPSSSRRSPTVLQLASRERLDASETVIQPVGFAGGGKLNSWRG